MALSGLVLASACGRSNLDAGECSEPEVEACARENGKTGIRQCFDGMWSECGRGSLPGAGSGGGGSGGQGGTAGRAAGGDAGRGGRPPEPVAGSGGLGGLAGEGPAGAAGDAGAGGQSSESFYCGDEQALFYLLSNSGTLYRVDADTLEVLGQVQVNVDGLNSMAVTRNGTVYASADLQIFRIDAFTGQAVDVGLEVSVLDGEPSVTIGYAPTDPVLSGESLLMAHQDAAGEIDLYAVPLSSFVPLWRHHFDGLSEYPEPLAAPNGRTFSLLAQGFVEYDPGIFAELGTLPVPDLLPDWSGDSAYLSGYLFAFYRQGSSSRIFRAQARPDIEDSVMVDLGTFPAAIIGAGAACLDRP